MKILIPRAYTSVHEQLALRYLREGRVALGFTEWKETLAGFDILHNALVIRDDETSRFRTIYEQMVDRSFANNYLEALLQLQHVAQEQDRLRAHFARQILQHLRDVGLHDPTIHGVNLLVAYCLYFWESFAMGYAFEVEITRDLRAAGIQFRAHDLRDRQARLSPYDLEILGLYGDIKNTLYFLQAGRSQQLRHDFYITRFYEGQRRYTLIVMVQLAAWQEIDGDTIAGLLQQATRHFPQPVQVELASGSIVVADYAIWKEKVLRRQQNDALA
ncbi:MAG: hypothetical protein R3C14_52850 [Caldilineaceae bacterium]